MAEKIELHAIYRKDGRIEIRDQHGREFDGVADTLASALERARQVVVGYELEAPRWPTDPPHVEIRIRVPLDVEERLPDWMLEAPPGAHVIPTYKQVA